MCLMAILKPKNNYTAQLLEKMENSVPFQKKVYLSQFLYASVLYVSVSIVKEPGILWLFESQI